MPDSDDQFSRQRPRFVVYSWVCRGGPVNGTEARHAACPRNLGHQPFLDDEDYRCDCSCHKARATLPSIPQADASGRMSPEDAEALLKK